MYKRRLWLQEAKRVDPPGRPADLVDYLLVLRDEPCVRTVPDSLLKAVSWMEKLAEFKLLRATGLAWAAKDKIVAVLYEGAPPLCSDGLARWPSREWSSTIASRQACVSMLGPSWSRSGRR